MAAAVDATNALLDAHWVPRKVVIDDAVAELVIETFTADLRKQKDVDCLGVFTLELEAAPHVDPLLVRDVPMHEAHAHSFTVEAIQEVRKGVPEAAEDHEPAVRQRDLLPYHPLQFLDFRVVGVKRFRLTEDVPNFGLDDAVDCCRPIELRRVGLHAVQVREAPSEYPAQEWHEPVQTTCRLPADHCHQKLHVGSGMQDCQNKRLRGEQVVMELPLRRGELYSHRVGLPHRKIANISALRAADDPGERVHLLDLPNHLYPFNLRHFGPVKGLHDRGESGISLDSEEAP